MPSIKKLLGVVAVGLVAVVSALPAQPRLDDRARNLHDISARQVDPATGLPDGLTDIDILQLYAPSKSRVSEILTEYSALTLEFLETAFYQQGFAQFSDADFTALGLSETDLTNLKSIGQTEQVHVTTLLSAIAGAGTQPVAPCTYNFGFTDAAGMVATASILENVGVSAYVSIPYYTYRKANITRYLGAAPLVTSAAILSVAAQIVTVESRHQTFIRTASKVAAVPSAFDTPLGIRNVFTLAAGFISSCPTGSNLAITPFSSLSMASNSSTAAAAAGSTIELSTSATGATFCAFTNGGQTGGTAFSPFANGACVVPENLAGLTYVNLASAGPLTGVLTDAITLAGPMVMQVS
ncbi:hypothetical protein B7494_g6402 [Chlorociboria aeruginascens]|nr:hypothetical protein B7494_g6402 [Chlorociboria aeruginascens]